MSRKFTVIAGPCVIEGESFALDIAKELKSQLSGLDIELYFKSSFDKANRSSVKSFRGPGLQEGLKILEKVRAQTGLPVFTDYHLPEQAEVVAQIVDFIQVPAFLCRQTDMILAGAEAALRHGRKLNIKKGQFLAPWDMKNAVDKAREVANAEVGRGPKSATTGGVAPTPDWLWVTERGVSFGYNRLVVDMISFQEMSRLGVPVIYDATHSVQNPGAAAGGTETGGNRIYLESLARAAFAAGAEGLFLECHPDPSRAKSDAHTAFYLESVGKFVRQLVEIKNLVAKFPHLLPEANP